MILLLLIAVPIAAALLVAAAPAKNARAIAGLGTLVPVLIYLFAARQFSQWHDSGYDFNATFDWFPSLGLRLTLGVDTVSMLLIGLTVLLGPICVFGSFTAISQRVKTYYSWLLVLQGAMTGVFCARDVVLFYVFFEFTLVPMYILINLYGSTNRRAAATKFFLYTFTGSLVTLAGLVYVAYVHATTQVAGEPVGWTFDFDALAQTSRALGIVEIGSMRIPGQYLVFWAMLAGFAVKVPLFPVHTWLPLAHTEAPTAGSVVLAGVLLKLGTYGLFRFVLQFAPEAAMHFAPLLGVLCIIGILYAGLICWVQTDVKKLVAYSSVSHLGFCVLGLFALNGIGISGSIMYMINHGLSTGALFLMIGMIYERYHTRNMRELGGLARRMPIWASFMVFFTMASVGLPGTNGFISEFMCLLGAFQAGGGEPGFPGVWQRLAQSSDLPIGATYGRLGPYFAFAAGIGMIVTAMYLLYMLGKVVWGPVVEPHGHGHAEHADHGPLPTDLSKREIALLLPLAALCLGIGLYPSSMLKTLEHPVRQTVVIIDGARTKVAAAVPAATSAPAVPAAPMPSPAADHGKEVNQ